MIFDYNAYMGGVDISDKKIYHYASERATHRYWTKIFHNLLDMALMNSFELYKQKTGCKTREKLSFVRSIIYSLTSMQSAEPTNLNENPTVNTGHRLVLLPGKKESNCVVCSKPGARKRSRHWCPICQVGVHEKCEKTSTILALSKEEEKRETLLQAMNKNETILTADCNDSYIHYELKIFC